MTTAIRISMDLAEFGWIIFAVALLAGFVGLWLGSRR